MPKAKPKPTIEPLDNATVPRVTQAKYVRGDPQAIIRSPGQGSALYSDKQLKDYLVQPIVKKQEIGRNKWADTAYILVLRAKRAAQSFGKKDFNSLYRLVLSAGIAFDKAFPQQVQPLGGNLVIQLFGSLGPGVAKRILEPARPTIIDVTPKVETPSVEQVDDNQ
jgi:hypothetical protein